MEQDQKVLMGKILGEIIRLQRRTEKSMDGGGDSRIYGLLHGFEHVIDEEIERIGWVSAAQVAATAQVLDVYFSDPDKLAAFKGFYDIEQELAQKGVDRMAAIKIITHFKANGQFGELIVKMNSTSSPIECKEFDLGDWDK